MSQHVAGAGSRSLVYEGGGRARGWRRRAALALVCVVAAFAVHAGAASAQTQIAGKSAAQQAFFQVWVNTSLVPTPPMQVKVTGQVCPGGQIMACSAFSSGTPVISFPDVSYLFAAPYTTDTVDQTRAHLEFMQELGRVYDRSQASHGGLLRSRFLRVMHVSGSGPSDASWTAGQIGSLTINPADLFAIAYGYCSVFPALPTAVLQNVYWGYGFNPTAPQYDRVCALISHASSPLAAAARRH